jgi:hypothetical protein
LGKGDKMEKRGELTSKQLITIIILIISFAIIIIFFVSLGLRKTVDSETCRNSVILRGSLPIGADTIQLKCRTQNICLSMGGDCGVTRKDLVTIEVDNRDELIKEMVNLLWDCWYKMGEGKVDYISAGLGNNEAYCSVCNNVYFDDKIQKEYESEGGINYSEIYNYMQFAKVPERDESFLFSIYGVSSLDFMRGEILKKNNYDIYTYKMNPEKEQAIVTSVIKNGWLDNALAGAGTGATLGAIGLGPGILFGGAAGFAVGVFTADDNLRFLAPRYLELNGAALKALDCKEYVSEG